MNTFDLTLDLSKQVSMEPLRLRQGDKSGTTVRATVYDHGELVSGSYTARIAMRHPGTGATYYRETGTFSNGVATFTIDEQYAATVTGRTTGYVQLLQGSTVIASTADFPVVILRDATEGAVPGEVYDSAIEDALAELDEATGRISVMVQEQVAEELAAHPEWTTTVTDNSVTDAKLVQTGGILSRVDRLMYRLDNLLTGDTGEQEVAVVADAAATPVAGLSVYGRSVQDGTPAPDAPVPIVSVEGNLAKNDATTRTVNGVTFTINADGSITADGTATANAQFDLVARDTPNAYLLPDGTYALGGCPSGGGSSTYELTLVYYAGTLQRVRDYGNGATYTFADGTGMNGCGLYIMIRSGQTVSGLTFRPMLVRGSVPLHYVPYGHAGLWAQGKNLADPTFPRFSYAAARGVTYTKAADGTITASGTASALAYLSLSSSVENPFGLILGETYTISTTSTSGKIYALTTGGNSASLPYTFEYGDGGYSVGVAVKNNDTVDESFKVMLSRGSTAQPYQPYVESVTPVPLGGHVLRSLPDGTRDEVTVDERGHAVLVQRVMVADLGTWNYGYNSTAAYFYCSITNKAVGNWNNVLCPSYQLTSSNVGAAEIPNMQFKATGASNAVFFKNTAYTDTASFKAAMDGVEIHYALATPVTHDLGYVDPVALTSPDATMQAVTGIATTFRADYERDLNVTLARLEAAIATLA